MVYNFPEEEKKILQFWEDGKIFEKLREKNKGSKKRWSFLDGPITANNQMGVHHAWGRTYKDLLQRYKAMQGNDERYQNGFDCQGLWVEVEVEKELGFKTKKDIEAYGIDRFVERCKERVWKYSAIQTKQSIRLGQWMDWENSYYTMSDENNYAIWHFLKKCWELGYLYKGRDSVPWCPRCGTAISQHEILTEEYKEITHDSIYFRLPIVGKKGEYLLVWTTTPWTLLANIAVAVDQKLDYALVQDENGFKNWVVKDLVEKIFGKGNPSSGSRQVGEARSKGAAGQNPQILKTVKGKDLVGLSYIFAFDGLPKVRETAIKFAKQFHRVVATDDRIMPITTEEGTGLVHTAVSAGQEDFQLGKKLGLPLIEVIDEEANYIEGFGEFSGKNAKRDPKIVLDYLAKSEEYVFLIEPYKHRYPTCWRCKTELVWRVVDEWYISMDKLRKPLEDIVKKMHWIPSFGKDRELDWLKNMHDWLISKKRYWGLALPIFECKECGHFEVIGSKEELKKRAIEGWDEFDGKSPHRPWVDGVKIKCKKCKAVVTRVKDVGNPWLDAGIVPFSTIKYFSDKPYWKKWFPAEVVTESFPGQFKNWFYAILVMSAVLEETEPVKTIFGYASVRDEKGEEMHKSKGNAIWFDDAVEKVGADLIRWFYAKQNPAENANFGYNNIEEAKRRLLVLYNVYSFFETYVKKEDFPVSLPIQPKNILDRWVASKLSHLVSMVEFSLEKYDIAKAVVAAEKFFLDDLSLWYLRRSRKRFHSSPTNFESRKDGADLTLKKSSKLVGDKKSKDHREAIAVLYYILLEVTKLIAPVIPFFAEKMYQQLKTEKMPSSVHLCEWPKIDDYADLDLEQKMDDVRKIVALALAERAAKAIKVRQPLASLTIKDQHSPLKNNRELLDLIKDEVNVEAIIFDDTIQSEVALDLNITPTLKEKGIVRDMIRFIQDIRKEAGLKPRDEILIALAGSEALQKVLQKNESFVLKEVKAKEMAISEITKEDVLEARAPMLNNIGAQPSTKNYFSALVTVDNQKLLISIKKK